MRIATWNVNGLRARLDYLRLWLRERQPDLVGLQELKLTDERFPHAEIEAEGYRAVTHGQVAWNGVAILARGDLEVTQRGLPGEDELGARLITANAGALSFSTVYVPNGKTVAHADFPRKLAWLRTLVSHFAEHHDPALPVVLCGDFNICPAAIDSWNEEALAGSIFHTEGERAAFRRLLDWGFRDLFRERFPEEQVFSWWDYRGGAFHRGHGLRIDFLLATDAILKRVESVGTDRDWRKKRDGLTASDHAPVVADLA